MVVLSYLGFLFNTWIETLFVLPFRNYEMLWLLVPVWVAWFFAEFYQEKTGTSLGNAITNAVVILWGSIDCTRQTVNLIMHKSITGASQIFLRFSLIAIIFAYGIIIIALGIKANNLVKYIGRVRVVTYVFAMFVPVFYNAIPFSWDHLLATILFFPIFYFVIELIDRIVPDPIAVIEDAKPKEEKHVLHHIAHLQEHQKQAQNMQTHQLHPENMQNLSPRGASYPHDVFPSGQHEHQQHHNLSSRR